MSPPCHGGGEASIPDDFAPMLADEIVVIVEACARLTREGSLTGEFIAGTVYRFHALPAREIGRIPAKPAYAGRETSSAVASLDDGRFGGGHPATSEPAPYASIPRPPHVTAGQT